MEGSPETLSCDVVVVGGGPTGMTVANLMAARGLSVLVLEQRLGTSDEPKAISLDDESLRIYQQAGIAEDVLGIIVPGTGTRYYDADNLPLFQAKATVPYRLGYPFKNPFAQPDLERILADALARNKQVSLRFGMKVIAVEQDDDGGRVAAVGVSGPLTVNARFVLGADGGRSTVREILGIAMTGRSYQDVWLVVDTLEDPHTERYGMHHGDPTRPHVIVPGLNGRCRYEFLLFPGEGEAGQSPDFGLIQRLVAPYRSIEPEQVERAVNYKFNALNADCWRSGRVFLLGDAAHMMPPFAGQGLNSGIRDAGNLAWKIADVVQGKAMDDVLDSYESERKPHVRATIELSVRLGRVVMTTSVRAAARRDAAVRSALATVEGRAFFEEMQYRPLARYRTGLVVGRPELAGAADLIGTAVGQPLAFDTGSRRTVRLDDALGAGWSILGIDVESGSWGHVRTLAQVLEASRWQVPLSDDLPRTVEETGVLLDLDGALYREFEPFRSCFVLLRPDRFVAAAWRPEDSAATTSAVARWRTTARAGSRTTAHPLTANPYLLRPRKERLMVRPSRLVLQENDTAGTLRHTAVSHIGFYVPDIAKAEAFYSRVLGLALHETLPGGTVRMGWGAGHHVLDLIEGPKGLAYYGFEVRDDNGIDGIRTRLQKAGHTVEALDASHISAAIGAPEGIVVVDPDGTSVHFHTPVHRQGENAADPGRRPIKFQHTTVGTADVVPMVDFFVNTIGFRISDQLEDGRFCWLRSDKDHHTLAVVNVGEGGDLDHYSYDLAEWEDFKSWCDRLTELDVPVAWGPGRHGPGNNIFVFFDDPAGNHIELSAEMEKFYDDRVTYVARQWEPAPGSVNLWGGQLPQWRTVSQSV